ncbi:MAG: DUF1844 domain-containing protein [Planctomycetota bacterium]
MSEDAKDKRIDESWKEQARKEKEKLAGGNDTDDTTGASKDTAKGSPRRPTPGGPLPEASFMMLVMSLAAQAMMHLGASPDPSTGQTEVNLEQAKFTIDLLSMLEEKTTGNLDENESKYLTSVLYDLRMQYVQASR